MSTAPNLLIRARSFEKALALLSDILSFNLAFAFIFWLRYKSGFLPDSLDPARSFAAYTKVAFVLSLCWIGYFFLTGLYRDWYLQSRAFQVMVVTKKITHGFFLLFLLTTGSDLLEAFRAGNVFAVFTWSRILTFSAYWSVFVVCVNTFRLFVQAWVRHLLRKGYGLDRMLILGVNGSGDKIRRDLEASPELGWKVHGFVDENTALKGTRFHGYPVLGKYSELPEILRAHHIRGIIISHESTSHNQILRVLSHVAEFPLSLFIVPDLYDAVSGHFKTSAVHGITLKVLFPEHMPAWKARIKRLMDIVFSAVFLLLASPFLLLTALAIRLDSRGPVFYSQERIGQYGKRFSIHKFRTMRTDAEKAGPQWATKRDPRVTRIGRFLRVTRIDEIPQLWCVLKGDMSLVGPRPERAHFIEQLRHEVPLYVRRLKMKPGLTGWAQVKHKYDSSIDDVKTKVMFDLWYFENMSLGLDCLILLRTVWVVLSGHGAH